MRLVFSTRAWDDYLHFLEHDLELLREINDLLEECRRHPFKGRGKPEPLKGDLTGWWSRRITREHRLVYRISGSRESQALEIAQLRFHY